VLKTNNLTDFHFRTIRQNRTKALVETRIEHAAVPWRSMDVLARLRIAPIDAARP
jgi:hypothetical protein